MAQPASNPKIEELRFRLKTDPKSRLFYQLAEELRRAGGAVEAEQVLRTGLSVYPTYLAAWVSLGRVLRELKNERAAVDALNTAMQLDPGNVVAARLLADAHLALGDKTEAIKKYKLVHALMPGDEELKARIDSLDRELHPPAVDAEAAPVPEQVPAAFPELPPESSLQNLGGGQVEPEWSLRDESPADAAAMDASPADASLADVFGTEESPEEEERETEESPFDKTVPPFDEGTGDLEPMRMSHDESPFEEPMADALAATFAIEQPAGMHVEMAPESAELAAPVFDSESQAFADSPGAAETSHAEDVTDTSTMADLYARQGLHNEARHIYEHILTRDPGNLDVRAKLDAITPRVNPKIDRLEKWLSRVSRKEVGSV